MQKLIITSLASTVLMMGMMPETQAGMRNLANIVKGEIIVCKFPENDQLEVDKCLRRIAKVCEEQEESRDYPKDFCENIFARTGTSWPL